jgi:hypothetical protein
LYLFSSFSSVRDKLLEVKVVLSFGWINKIRRTSINISDYSSAVGNLVFILKIFGGSPSLSSILIGQILPR